MNNKDFSKKVILALGLFLLVFIAVMVVTYWVMGSVPDVLVQCVLGAGGLEAIVLGVIKTFKVRSSNQPKQIPDEYVATDIIDE